MSDGDALLPESRATALDWLLRLRPSIWLRAAGLAAESDALAQLPSVRSSGDVRAVWKGLADAAVAVRNGCDAAWQAVAAACRAASAPARGHVWAAVATVTWADAVSGAGYRLLPTTRAAGLDAGAAMLRTASRPDRPGAGWEVACDAATDAASALAWQAVAALAGSSHDFWAMPPDAACVAAHAAVQGAMAPVWSALAVAAARAEGT